MSRFDQDPDLTFTWDDDVAFADDVILRCDDCGREGGMLDNIYVPALPCDVTFAQKGDPGCLCDPCAERLLSPFAESRWDQPEPKYATAYAARCAEPMPDLRYRLECAACGFHAEGAFGAEGAVRFLAEHDAGTVAKVTYPTVRERDLAALARA
jgi:hypothetical protein